MGKHRGKLVSVRIFIGNENENIFVTLAFFGKHHQQRKSFTLAAVKNVRFRAVLKKIIIIWILPCSSLLRERLLRTRDITLLSMSVERRATVDITLRLPPRPDILKSKPNPYYERDGAVVFEGFTLPKARLDALYKKLGRSTPSRELDEHDRNLLEVLERRSSPSPVNVRSDKASAARFYASAVASQRATQENLCKKYLAPVHRPITISSAALEAFVGRNYDTAMKTKLSRKK
jgi:hypothetical protein